MEREPGSKSRSSGRERWARGCALVLGLLLLGLTGWAHYRTRHRLLRGVSWIEARLGGGGPPATPASRPLPHYLHGARTAPGQAMNGRPTVQAAAGAFRCVELDVAFSRDGVPFLSHNDDLQARGGSPAPLVEEQSARELAARELLDGSRLLRLDAFLTETARRFDAIVLDVKTSHARASTKAAALVELIPPDLLARLIVVSTSGPLLFQLQQARPELRLGCESYLAWGNALAGFDVLSLDGRRVEAALDARARRWGLQRLYWTAWSEPAADALRAWGPDAIIVDLGGEAPPAVPAPWRVVR